MKCGIKILPREVILDTQGRAVEQSLRSNGFNQLNQIKVGKYIQLDLPMFDFTEAKSEIEKMLKEGGLYNPLIEQYQILQED